MVYLAWSISLNVEFPLTLGHVRVFLLVLCSNDRERNGVLTDGHTCGKQNSQHKYDTATLTLHHMLSFDVFDKQSWLATKLS